MLANIVNVTHGAQQVALQQERGAILLLDFKAAFPSLSHDHLHTVLEALGVPDNILAMVKNLYCDHRCNVLFGEPFPGFDIGAGIVQGCPLSPLLFALVIDIVLRRIQR